MEKKSTRKARFAAVIPAAGLSSRMGDFKPLMPMGDTTVLRWILRLLQENGITDIAVVTGYRSEDMKKALAGEKVTILYNGDYKRSHMFDSVRMGFAHMKERADYLILWPVDIPAVTQDTVAKLLQAAEEGNGKVILPCHKGIHGHPVIFASDTYETVLRHDGREGMYGVLKKLKPLAEVEVDDPFVLMDMDTREDYRAVLEKKQAWEQRQVTPFTFSFAVSLRYGEDFFDEKLVCLLRFVERTGSLKKACEEMGVAYSYGWKAIKKAENRAGFPLLAGVSGGRGGGGSTLTEPCRQLIAAYEGFCRQLQDYGQSEFHRWFSWCER